MKKTFAAYFLFCAAVLFLFLFQSGQIPLWSSDEGRSGEIAREMILDGNFVLPHFNGIDYLHKPAFTYVLMAAAYAVLGINSLAARAPMILAAILGILMAYGFVRRIFGRKTAEVAAVVLTTSVGYVLVGRFAVIDMIMTFFLSGAMLCLISGLLGNKRWYLAAYGFMGLAFLTKGLTGILLPALVYLVFLVWTKNLSEVKKMKPGWGVLIIAAIGLPWVMAVSRQEPDFIDVFFIQNHFGRFTTAAFGRVRPFWFFVPILFATAFPWSFFLPLAVRRALGRPETGERLKVRFLISWIAVIFVFFSIPKSKLPYYLLPLSVPVAVLVSTLFSSWMAGDPGRTGKFAKWTWRAIVFVCAGTFLGLNGYLLTPIKDPEIAALRPVLHAGTWLLLAGSLAAYRFYTRDRMGYAFLTLAGMIYLGLLFAVAGMKTISPFESAFEFARVVDQRARKGDTVAVYASPDRFSDFIFYLGRRVVIAGSDRGSLTEESLEPEQAQDAKELFLGASDFVLQFNARTRRIFCLLENKKLRMLEEQGLKDYFVIRKVGRKQLISNFP